MAVIEFNQGVKEYSIAGDPDRVIRFVPSDFNFLNRAEQAIKEIEKIANKYSKSAESNAEQIAACDAEIRRQIDYIFGSDVCTAAFGNTNCTSLAGGNPLYENFLNAVIPVIQKCVKDEKRKAEKNISKYTSQVKE